MPLRCGSSYLLVRAGTAVCGAHSLGWISGPATACLGLVGSQGTGMLWLVKLGLKAKILIRGLTGSRAHLWLPLWKSWKPEQQSRARGHPLTLSLFPWPAEHCAPQGSAPEKAELSMAMPTGVRTCSRVSLLQNSTCDTWQRLLS